MRVLMLGWEFPPYISGGLGTACYGLTRALDAAGHEITFVLPRPVDASHASHVKLISPEPPSAAPRPASPPGAAPVPPPSEPPPPIDPGEAARGQVDEQDARDAAERTVFEKMRILDLGVRAPSVYGDVAGPESQPPALEAEIARRELSLEREPRPGGAPLPPAGREGPVREALRAAGVDAAAAGIEGEALTREGDEYSGDATEIAARYAGLVLSRCRHEPFDVVHAHDWMTYPAGLAIARITGKPLVAHIHSTEFDRSGVHVNQAIYDIERRGMHGATRVIAVSYLTRSTCLSRYGLEPDKVKVVYNGVEWAQPEASLDRVRSRDKIVLFLGRITMQKGPEYFIAAARRVLEKMDNVKFIVAGSGDLARRMIELAAESGIGHKVLFTGFLRGDDVSRVFQMADLYVMPSVSEPFGIAPLEAMCHDTPVLISKQSGVSEVLSHALKVDFWDTDEMANKILAVLRHPPLSQMLREHGAFEVRGLTWEGAATRCAAVYEEAVAASRRAAV